MGCKKKTGAAVNPEISLGLIVEAIEKF